MTGGLYACEALWHSEADSHDDVVLLLCPCTRTDAQLRLFTHSPDPLRHLCNMIRYAYIERTDSQQLKHLLSVYCLVHLDKFQLGQSRDFQALISSIPGFGPALCRVSYDRNFFDDGAAEIPRLVAQYCIAPANDKALNDFNSSVPDPCESDESESVTNSENCE